MFQRQSLEFPDHIKLKHSKRARRMALRLDPKDRVFHLVLPTGMSLRKAQRFAEEHESWMQNKLRELPSTIPFTDGTAIPVFGQETKIQINRDLSLKRTHIELKNNRIIVSTNLDNPSGRIERFLKKTAKEKLTSLSHEKAAQIHKCIKTISVRDTKSRWGSCSADGNVSYSWRLIFAHYDALDYVVAHEVAHLQHLDHSKSFWNVCRDLSDNFVEGQYWIRNHGHELMRYGIT